MEVVFFQRKPRAVGNYSVEFIFEDVRSRLAERIQARVEVSPHESSGLWKRLQNCLAAAKRQGVVNHVTGDVNYLGLMMDKKRTIQTILDCVHLESSRGLKHQLLKLFWVSIPERNARYITAISEATKQEILRHHPCDPDKIIVIPVAISDRFVLRPHVFNFERPRILQLGTAPNKNIPRLIEAIEGLDVTLHIIGKKTDELTRLLQEKNIEHVFESGLSDEEVRDRYAAADIVSLVSTYEGFGMPILEGQATGRPVITSNILSMPEVAGDAAVLVDPTDTAAIRAGILRIISDAAFREHLVRKGMENIRKYNPDVIADSYYQLYQSIAES
jgi:glycosyltransferase involved in cell wall biosynthesis